MRSWEQVRRWSGLVSMCAALSACAAGDTAGMRSDARGAPTSAVADDASGSPPAPGGSAGDFGNAGGVAGADGSRADGASPSGVDPADGLPGDGCGGVSARAEVELLPTDVVWAIDTSGSMNASYPAIQQALTTFSQKVEDAGVDAHIVLLAGAAGSLGGQGFCVPAPLGSGSCGPAVTPGGSAADSREPEFLHLDLPFGSTLGMATLLDNYDSYKHLLRPNARTQLVLTEDGAPPMTAAAVTEHVEGRTSATFTAPWSPGLAPGSYQWNGVVCSNGTGIGTCLLAFGLPQTTLDLAQSTGGLVSNLDEAGSVAADPFAELLDKLAEAVIVGAQVSCDYEIPPAPAGETFDRELVNVAYSSGMESIIFPRAGADIDCGEETAWKYDDEQAPTRVLLCPAACERVRADPAAQIDVRFGCATELLRPD